MGHLYFGTNEGRICRAWSILRSLAALRRSRPPATPAAPPAQDDGETAAPPNRTVWHESFFASVVEYAPTIASKDSQLRFRAQKAARGAQIGILLIVFAAAAHGAILPGFSVQQIATTTGFCSSLAIDSRGVVYYTTTTGDLFRLGTDGASTKVAHVPTQFIGNSGLLGMTLLDDSTAVVHYTTPGPTAEVVSRIDLNSGTESVIATIPDDAEVPGRLVPSEHHGGEPVAGDDGAIYVGIGDFGTFLIAAKSNWNAGKILRIAPDGTVSQMASGFRNPFGMAWDPVAKRLIVADNGDIADDEIDIVAATGGFYGWPYTMGTQAAYPGAVPPLYVFPKIVAPTGMVRVRGSAPYLQTGYLLGAFVSKAVYYIPDIDARPLPDPIALVNGETGPVVDVTEGPDEVLFATGTAVYRLNFPQRGDCNGDGLVNFADLTALDAELASGTHPVYAAKTSWGCDANGDGVISSDDRDALLGIVFPKRRAAR